MSDYISREELSDNLCYGISCNECSFNTTNDGQSGCLLQERIDNLVSADVREIPEGLTNEDVLNDTLRRVFPRVIFIRSIDELNKTQGIHMSEEWLRQPYKGADMRGDT